MSFLFVKEIENHINKREETQRKNETMRTRETMY